MNIEIVKKFISVIDSQITDINIYDFSLTMSEIAKEINKTEFFPIEIFDYFSNEHKKLMLLLLVNHTITETMKELSINESLTNSREVISE